MLANFAAENWSQWTAFALCTWAAFWTFRGAHAGAPSPHRAPLAALGVILSFMSTFYVLLGFDVITDPAIAAAIMRGVAFVMYPCIAWLSISGIRYARKIRRLTTILEGTETNEAAWKQHG